MSCINRPIAQIVCGALLLAGAAAHAQTFPASGWLSLTQQGSPYADPAGDETPATTPYLDVVGDRTYPATFVASDASFLYFRLRVAGNPIKPANSHFYAYAWTCLLDTDADPTTYELLTGVDGMAIGGASVDLYQNTSTSKADSIDDAAETLLTTYLVANGAAEAIDAKSTVGGVKDYFVDWAVAWSDLGASLQQGAPFRLVCGSSTAETSLTAGDVLDNGSGSASFSATASDALFCTDAGCQYDAIFKDGFEGP